MENNTQLILWEKKNIKVLQEKIQTENWKFKFIKTNLLNKYIFTWIQKKKGNVYIFSPIIWTNSPILIKLKLKKSERLKRVLEC